jgi:hypothetical protein
MRPLHKKYGTKNVFTLGEFTSLRVTVFELLAGKRKKIKNCSD